MDLLELLLALAVIFAAIFVFGPDFGKFFGSTTGSSEKKKSKYKNIPDRFHSFHEVQDALNKAGLESCNLILGIDYTGSNNWTGASTFGGKCLHDIESSIDPVDSNNRRFLNPYQEVISIVGRTLERFDDDRIIPCFGFGDIRTTDKSVFPLHPKSVNGEVAGCHGFEEVLTQYNRITPSVSLNGPTSFVPLIEKAIEIVRETQQYHVLVIVADGQVSDARKNQRAIEEASNYPLSIVMIGVGDGPWDTMEKFDDELPQRRFDNFQFVPFSKKMRELDGNEHMFAMHALMEIPDQFCAIRELGLL